jgi:aminoglycoside phosphotransferase (APT) family kinase protein
VARVWDAERIVEPQLALALINDQFPDLLKSTDQHIEQFGVGFDNTAYLINGVYIFRFPRRQIAVPLLETESRALPHLAGRLPLAVPLPEWVGQPSPQRNYPWPFAGYKLLPGTTACRVEISDDQRTGNAETLAKFLRALHSLPLAEGERWRLPGDVFKKLDLEKRIPQTHNYLSEIVSHGLLNEDAGSESNKFPESIVETLTKLIDSARGLRPTSHSTILHGDFYARHLLVDGKRTVTAVIDWGDICIGDPAIDLSVAHSFLPPHAHDAFKAAYGSIPENTWLLARFRALSVSLVLMSYGHDIGDPHLIRAGRQALRYIASR